MYDYPLEPDWSTEEIIEVVGLYNAVEQAYEEGISSKEFMEHYRAFTSNVLRKKSGLNYELHQEDTDDV